MDFIVTFLYVHIMYFDHIRAPLYSLLYLPFLLPLVPFIFPHTPPTTMFMSFFCFGGTQV
jgi:hypothetical protein